MAGDWYAFRTMKKMVKWSGNSGDILDLRSFSGGVPWNNPKIFVSFYGYIPDLTKNRFFTSYEDMGNDKFKILCQAVGFIYQDSFLAPDVVSNTTIGGSTVLYNGSFYGISFDYNGNTGTHPVKGTAGQDAYINSNIFNSVLTSNDPNPSVYCVFYSANFFSKTLQNGVVSVKNTRLTRSGIFQNIRVFPTPSTIATGLPVQVIAIEGDY